MTAEDESVRRLSVQNVSWHRGRRVAARRGARADKRVRVKCFKDELNSGIKVWF